MTPQPKTPDQILSFATSLSKAKDIDVKNNPALFGLASNIPTEIRRYVRDYSEALAEKDLLLADYTNSLNPAQGSKLEAVDARIDAYRSGGKIIGATCETDVIHAYEALNLGSPAETAQAKLMGELFPGIPTLPIPELGDPAHQKQGHKHRGFFSGLE